MKTKQDNNNHKSNTYAVMDNTKQDDCNKSVSTLQYYINIWFNNFTNKEFVNKLMAVLKALNADKKKKFTPEDAYIHAVRMFRDKMFLWNDMDLHNKTKAELLSQVWSSKINTWEERGKYFWDGKKWICRNCEREVCECRKERKERGGLN